MFKTGSLILANWKFFQTIQSGNKIKIFSLEKFSIYSEYFYDRSNVSLKNKLKIFYIHK